MTDGGRREAASQARDGERRSTVPAGTRLIGALVLTYVVLIVGLAFSGRFTFVWKTSVVPALLVAAIVTRQGARFVREWAPLLGAVILFDALRGFVFGLVTALRLPIYARYAIEAEEALFGGYTLPNLVQSVFLRDGRIGAFEKALVVVHGSHFFVFLVFGFAVWLLRREAFGQFCAALFLLLTVGIGLYLVVPTVPPWMAASTFHLIPPIQHVSSQVYNTVVPVLGKTFDVNPIAAMPSLHTGIPVLCSLVAWRHFRARGLAVIAYTVAVCVAIVYLGEHYYVDVLAGAALATAVYLVIYRTNALERLGRSAAVARAHTLLGHRHSTIAPLAFGLLLTIAAEGIGQLGASIRRPLPIDEEFVRRELVGRSDLANLALARLALERGDDASAARLLDLARHDVLREDDRATIAELRDHLARKGAASSTQLR